jgi:hypothetical protein
MSKAKLEVRLAALERTEKGEPLIHWIHSEDFHNWEEMDEYKAKYEEEHPGRMVQYVIMNPISREDPLGHVEYKDEHDFRVAMLNSPEYRAYSIARSDIAASVDDEDIPPFDWRAWASSHGYTNIKEWWFN